MSGQTYGTGARRYSHREGAERAGRRVDSTRSASSGLISAARPSTPGLPGAILAHDAPDVVRVGHAVVAAGLAAGSAFNEAELEIAGARGCRLDIRRHERRQNQHTGDAENPSRLLHRLSFPAGL